MTMNLIDSTSISANGAKNGTLELKSEASTAASGTHFGQHLSDLFQIQADQLSRPAADTEGHMTEPSGQEIADAQWLIPPTTTPAMELLQAQTLGPHLNVITPTSSAPDEQSLEAFALAQGLDAQAVHWLFGGQTNTAVAAAPSTDPQAPNTLTWTLGNTLATATLATAPAAAPAATPTPSITGTVSAAAAATLTQAQAPTAGLPALANNPNTPLPETPTGTNAGLLGSAMTGIQALWAMADGHHSASPKPVVASNPTSTEDVLPVQMLRMTPPAAIWMQRSAMVTANPDKSPAPTAPTISLSDLDLGADWGGDVLQQLLASEGNASSGSNATGTHGSAYANFASRWDAQAANRSDLAQTNPPASSLSDAAARSDNIQNLADKMGQAVGQRILSEMERGQWHLKLTLRPATLGHIEVEMRMRSGEFDAVFTAPNAVTRDLLQDGLGKLRETLGQMGMDVANIHVGDGQTGQSGGDPTPGSFRSQPASSEAKAPESPPETPRAPSVKDPQDGLDVLV